MSEQSPHTNLTVLNVLNELMPSGAETMLRSAGAEWEIRGVSPRVLAVSPHAGPFAAELRAAGYQVAHLWDRSPAKLVLKFRKQLRRFPVDVVHLHAERGNFWLALAARSVGSAVVRTVHNVFSFSGALRVERTVQRAALRFLGVQMVAVSTSVQGNEKTRFRNPASIVDNWFDPDRFARRTESERLAARAELLSGLGQLVEQDPFVIATVGNCSDVKNHSLLAHSLAKIGNSVPWVWLHLGREDAEQSERKLSQSLDIAHRLLFLDPTGQTATVLAAADAYVMPSRYEGMSIAAIEAMARGVPVVFTDVPGLRDLAMESEAVKMVPEDPDALAAAIQELATQTAPARDQIGSTLAEAVRLRHSMSQGVAAYIQVYCCALRRKTTPGL